MAEDDRTEELPERDENTPGTTDGGPRRLYRSRDDRVIGGVAGGLGRYFGVDPLIIRIGFAISIFFGGLGALAYIGLVLFVPEEAGGAEGRPLVERSRWAVAALAVIGTIAALSALGSLFFWDGNWGWGGGPWGLLWLLVLGAAAYLIYNRLRDRDRDEPLRGGRLLAAIALAILAIAGLGVLALASAFAGATGSGAVIAATVVVIGVLLVLAAFRGGARWLIAPALALAIPLGAVSAADISFGGGIGEREYRPSSSSALPDDGYELGIGRLVVDLRDLEWREDTVIDLDVDLGIGQAIVAVPERVCIDATARTTGGELDIAGDRSDGFDVETSGVGTSSATPRLELDGEVEFGVLRVINDDDADLDEHFGPRWDHDGSADDDERTALAREACAR